MNFSPSLSLSGVFPRISQIFHRAAVYFSAFLPFFFFLPACWKHFSSHPQLAKVNFHVPSFRFFLSASFRRAFALNDSVRRVYAFLARFCTRKISSGIVISTIARAFVCAKLLHRRFWLTPMLIKSSCLPLSQFISPSFRAIYTGFSYCSGNCGTVLFSAKQRLSPASFANLFFIKPDIKLTTGFEFVYRGDRLVSFESTRVRRHRALS